MVGAASPEGAGKEDRRRGSRRRRSVLARVVQKLRPSISQEVRALILELARNDSNWGYRSIRDRLSNLGHQVSHATVASALREHVMEPAPKRSKGMSWATFLKAHWPQLAAIEKFGRKAVW